jgi:hypothetical protein
LQIAERKKKIKYENERFGLGFRYIDLIFLDSARAHLHCISLEKDGQSISRRENAGNVYMDFASPSDHIIGKSYMHTITITY